jgi:hypothetical protein
MIKKTPSYEMSRGVNGNPVPLDNLRLEVSAESFFLMSYHHIDFARFDSAKAGDVLTIRFLTHEVTVTGRKLRDLALGLQERCVEFIKPFPTRYSAALGVEDGGLVESIEVKNLNNQ